VSSSSTTVTESVVAFLEKIPPFQFLPAPEIRALARTMTLEYFPKDTVILAAGRQVSEALYIVQKGAVKLGIRTNVGKGLVLDMRSERVVFGLLSLMGRDVARLDVVALEDAVVTARLWQKILAKLEGMKVATLGHLLKVAKA